MDASTRVQETNIFGMKHFFATAFVEAQSKHFGDPVMELA